MSEPGRSEPAASGPSASSIPCRQGIFGIETEYALLYVPDDPTDPGRPPFETIEQVLFESILRGRKSALSSGLKGGYFLENGGLIHLEIFLRTQADTPILEASTPECRTPRELLNYQRAFDRILEEASVASVDLLAAQGFAGRISFGKNNRDIRGIGYGTHENYLIHHRPSLWARLALLLGAPLILPLLAPSVLFILLILAAAIGGGTFARLFPELAARIQELFRTRLRRLLVELRGLYFFLMNALLLVPIGCYTTILRFTAFLPFRRDIMSFLAARQILTGSGGLDLRKGIFEISQRPALISSLAGIVMFGRHKTVFDLKGLLYDPLSLFRPTRKLTITVGDSNLSDPSLLLNTGTTAIVLEMIEAGEDFSDLRLRHPLRAFREVSRGGPWKELAVVGPGDPETPGRVTPVGIQREYLRRARKFLAARPGGLERHRAILDLWEEALEDLAELPSRLADRLDWAAKKSLLDAAVQPFGWKAFLAWGRIFSRAEPRTLAAARTLEEFLAASSPFRRWAIGRQARRALGRGEIDPGRFLEARDLHHEALKIDLRYHEIGADPGYQRQLEAAGLIRRIAGDDEIARACRIAPPGTRARIRGYYISIAQGPESIRVNWRVIDLIPAGRTIPIPDPFESRLPTDP